MRARYPHALLAILGAGALVASIVASPVLPARASDGDADTSAPIAAAVQKALDAKDSSDFWVRFDRSADTTKAPQIANWKDRGQKVVDSLKSTAQSSQAQAIDVLKKSKVDYTSYWVTNAIYVRDGSEALATELAGLDGVKEILAPKKYTLDQPAASHQPDQTVDGVEWGVAAIHADQVWSQFHDTGQGIVVASIDTGVDYTHPALVNQYRGNNGDGTFDNNYNWFDATGQSDSPFDGAAGASSHGTHTMGTMVGDDGQGNQVGVAPGAKWIAANGCNTCSDTDLIASGQWILAPTDLNGQNPDVSKRPNIVNNSWGSQIPSNDPFMEDIEQAWNASGIFAAWSNGNNGPSCQTSGSPGSRTLNYSTGAFDSSGTIADFSSRGSGQDGEIKPNISAPGVNVRSSVSGGGYAQLSGTSMAAPHLAGAVALLWSAAPSLIGDIDQTRALLDQTAQDVDDTSCGGTAADNDVYGEGRLDALALLQAAPVGDTGTVSGTVNGSNGGLQGTTLRFTQGSVDRQVTTDAQGAYSLTLPVGTYDVAASAFGYQTFTGTTSVTKDQTSTLDVSLQAAPTHTVSGTVTDKASGDPVAGATVSVDGTPLDPATSDAHGAYSISGVPEGAYTFTASGGACASPASTQASIVGDTTLDIAIGKRSDQFGYTCSTGSLGYVEGDTPVDLTGDDAATSVDLPFAFPFYGQLYSTAYVSSNGHVNFLAPSTALSNTAIPDAALPNAAIYPFWDDLYVDADAGVYTKTTSDAFTIEYRNVRRYADTAQRLDFDVTLHEDGTVDLVYRGIDPTVPEEQGSSATVGIENADGTDGLQYSFDEPVLSDSTSISFDLPAFGYVTGTVTDANDAQPVSGATVTLTDADGASAGQATTGDDGTYTAFAFLGDYTATVEATNYKAVSQSLAVKRQGQKVRLNASLKTGVATLSRSSLTWILRPGDTRTAKIKISNTGSANLAWSASEVPHASAAASAPAKAAEDAKANPNARTALGQYSDEQLTALKAQSKSTAKLAAAAKPNTAGDVLAQWPAQGVTTAWGLGFDGDVWVSDASDPSNHQYSTDGTPGSVFDADWGGTWAGDLAQDTSTGALCQVNVGGDNAIHCFDPATGTPQYTISGSAWTSVSQRGLAYDRNDDTFFVGGWNEGVIYKVAGLSHTDPGAVLSQVTPEDPAIAGIAYNPTSDTIWYVNSSLDTELYQIDPASGSTISTIPYPVQDQGPGAGLDLNADGSLWATNQLSGDVYQIETDVPNATDVPWLDVEPPNGNLAPGTSQQLVVSVDTAGLEPGTYTASILLKTTAGRTPTVTIPIKVVVSAYQVGVNAGGGVYTDSSHFDWYGDQPYSADSGWGWVADTTSTHSSTADIAGTTNDPLFQTNRTGDMSYRFDAPAGVYTVNLDFAELGADAQADKRLFDVSADGKYVLVAYDIAGTVGARTADQYTFRVNHKQDGPLVVQFHPRRSYQKPLVSALKVTERPDLEK